MMSIFWEFNIHDLSQGFCYAGFQRAIIVNGLIPNVQTNGAGVQIWRSLRVLTMRLYLKFAWMIFNLISNLLAITSHGYQLTSSNYEELWSDAFWAYQNRNITSPIRTQMSRKKWQKPTWLVSGANPCCSLQNNSPACGYIDGAWSASVRLGTAWRILRIIR